jgi:hypothetical protein
MMTSSVETIIQAVSPLLGTGAGAAAAAAGAAAAAAAAAAARLQARCGGGGGGGFSRFGFRGGSGRCGCRGLRHDGAAGQQAQSQYKGGK